MKEGIDPWCRNQYFESQRLWESIIEMKGSILDQEYSKKDSSWSMGSILDIEGLIILLLNQNFCLIHWWGSIFVRTRIIPFCRDLNSLLCLRSNFSHGISTWVRLNSTLKFGFLIVRLNTLIHLIWLLIFLTRSLFKMSSDKIRYLQCISDCKVDFYRKLSTFMNIWILRS